MGTEYQLSKFDPSFTCDFLLQVESDLYASHDASVLSAQPSMLYDTNQTKEDLVKEILKQQLLVLDNNETRL
jgi:hypothetical protein